ncbi:trace amine-associated receptor 13c-like [Kryptolebias marmoratus]|uniref:trace amine-associated receptor 13c-like n=1 Tax=Kryptolebias marmoratus TaxID=37003 RepID=UPI0018ACB1F6|nr:trace amine-associated receptor 13c-like [Kryptolebias marmoratus]
MYLNLSCENFLIMLFSFSRQLHKTTNFLLLSLAVSDFMVGLVFFPGEIVRLTDCWFFGDYMCLLYSYIVSLIVTASIGTIVLISADRYVAICDPLHYHTRITMKRIQTCICLCWLYSVLYNISFVKNGLKSVYNSCYGKCSFSIDFFAVAIDLVLTFFLPVTVIIILYLRVFVMAVFQARAIRSQVTVFAFQHSVTPTAKKSELKAARTLGVLVVVFLICFCPYYCAALAGENSFNASVVVFCLFSINSCLNPVIYALFYPWFRKAIKHIITLKILQPGSCDVSIM